MSKAFGLMNNAAPESREKNVLMLLFSRPVLAHTVDASPCFGQILHCRCMIVYWSQPVGRRADEQLSNTSHVHSSTPTSTNQNNNEHCRCGDHSCALLETMCRRIIVSCTVGDTTDHLQTHHASSRMCCVHTKACAPHPTHFHGISL